MLAIVSNEPGKACLTATTSHATTLGDMVSSALLCLWSLSIDWSQAVEDSPQPPEA